MSVLGEPTHVADRADRAFLALSEYARSSDYRGYEFDDFLASPLVRTMCFNRLLLQRVAVQVGELSPVNFRWLLGIHRLRSTKALGFFAKGYLYYYQRTREEAWLLLGLECLDRLLDNACTAYPGLSWGNEFDFASRAGFFPKGLPTVVWTAHIATVFEHAYSITGREEYLDALRQTGTFILSVLERHEDDDGICFAYAPGHLELVHNSNLLAAATLLRCGMHFGDRVSLDAARSAYAWSLRRMNPDGGWYYGVDGRYRWIDSFHTAYVLDCLVAGHDMYGDEVVPEALIERTYHFWVSRFFQANGTPGYYHDRTWPLDIQCASQAIESLSKWASRFEGALSLAENVVNWTIDNMQKPNGAFRYQVRPFWKNNLESIHWGEATMLAALGAYLYYSSVTATEQSRSV